MRKNDWSSKLTSQAEVSLKEMGQQLAKARERRGFSVAELARRTGVDRRTIAQLEQGYPGVSIGVFFQLMSFLNLLPGLSEALNPENDLEAIQLQLRQLRKGNRLKKKISKSEVAF
ncbi:helix-turn-helix domain-containing protein [Bdellovibrio sp.]|uniref:helix-turn-helix domain-containing protein n=1 Tax=Bdellovibrio sp. TaxID=28201 RepID=UPI0039E71957